jgi:hypothetical protein
MATSFRKPASDRQQSNAGQIDSGFYTHPALYPPLSWVLFVPGTDSAKGGKTLL